jgi:hypothetical protein
MSKEIEKLFHELDLIENEYLHSYEYYQALERSRDINRENLELLPRIDEEIQRLRPKFRKQRLDKILKDL